MRLRLVLALLLAAACEKLPDVLPPGFGTGPAASVSLFFPTGLAVTPQDDVVVANGNFGHAYGGGTMVTIQHQTIEGIFAKQLSCTTDSPVDGGVPVYDSDGGGCDPVPVYPSAVMIGNYAGPVVLSDDGTVAYTGSRDSNTLNAVSIGPDGQLSCFPGAGTTPDCRHGLVNLSSAAHLEGPFGIAAGSALVPGRGDVRVLFVSSLVPTVVDVQGGIDITQSEIAVLDQSAPQTPLFTMLAGDEERFVANGTGVGPILYDGARRRIIASGCYERFGSSGSGEPSTAKCVDQVTNYLRFLSTDALDQPLVELYDLYPDVQSTDTVDMVFGAPDPVSGAATTLWVILQNPDVLARVELPSDPSIGPRVQEIVPLPSVPSSLLRLPRPGQGDLIAVTSERMGAVTIFDADAHAVVANVERLGDTPARLQLWNDTGTSAQLVVSVFGSCRVALVEVPYADPSQAALRGRIGGCEE